MTTDGLPDDAGETVRFAARWLAIEPTDVPGDVRDATARIIADCLACAIAAFDTEPARAVIAHRRQLGGANQSTIVVDGDRLSCAAAAYVNTQLVNILDADETLLNFSHIASTIVMPAIAVGEMTSATGADVVAAVAVGFEVASRIGLALPNYAIADGAMVVAPSRGFSWAAFGTAAATARLLGLDAHQLATAFAIVMSTTPVHGCLERFRTDIGQWHKAAMYGAIAEAGVSAALLAQHGFRADETVLDRDSSWFRSFGATEWFPEALWADHGGRWLIAETSIKPYPFCRYAHGAIDAFDSIIRTSDLTAAEIEEVIVTTPPFAFLQSIIDAPWPTDVMAIASSLPYAFAMVGARVPPGPAWWDAEQLDADSRRLATRVRSAVDQSLGPVMTEQIRTEGFFRRLPLTVQVR
ncbi:MAG TPA: MmgE/PrpD family protein, partial [Ilumatobacteraceae bacterium]